VSTAGIHCELSKGQSARETADRAAAKERRTGFLVPEYSLIDKVHLLAGCLDTFSVLYPGPGHDFGV
jgi:hypothetical protein